MTRISALLLATLMAFPAISNSTATPPIGQLIYLPAKPVAPADFMAVPVAMTENGKVFMQWMFVPAQALANLPAASITPPALMPALPMTVAPAAPAAATPKPAANSTHARSMTATCNACHGTDGKSHTAIPPLAGLDKAYFVQQMQDFKSGKREATVMHQHAKGYTDEEFQQMADFFAAIKP